VGIDFFNVKELLICIIGLLTTTLSVLHMRLIFLVECTTPLRYLINILKRQKIFDVISMKDRKFFLDYIPYNKMTSNTCNSLQLLYLENFHTDQQHKSQDNDIHYLIQI
jgi:hypothetical protein